MNYFHEESDKKSNEDIDLLFNDIKDKIPKNIKYVVINFKIDPNSKKSFYTYLGYLSKKGTVKKKEMNNKYKTLDPLNQYSIYKISNGTLKFLRLYNTRLIQNKKIRVVKKIIDRSDLILFLLLVFIALCFIVIFLMIGFFVIILITMYVFSVVYYYKKGYGRTSILGPVLVFF